jgi:hypothetical protein
VNPSLKNHRLDDKNSQGERRMNSNNQEFSFLINQIVRTMGMEPDIDDGDGRLIWVDDDWKIFLPDDDQPCVVIIFDDLMKPYAAADIAMRFSKILDLFNVQVVIGHESESFDSTNSIEFTGDSTAMIGFTAKIN